jgi:hypothetical protein
MEALPLYEITGGSHKGQIGTKIGESIHFVKLQLETKVVRCKHEFATLYQPPEENDIDLEQQLLADLKIAHELEDAEREAERQRCVAQSAMIAEQNRAYEESVKVDLETAQKAQESSKKPELQFEEVSLEEMRRVRLQRFQQS